MRIDYSEQMVTWEWDGCVIKIELQISFMRNIIKMRTLLSSIVEKNFVSKIIFYFSLEGKLLGQQNLLEGTVDWNHNGQHQIVFSSFTSSSL